MTILTDETIKNTRLWFANNADACINEVIDGSVKVNHNFDYFCWRMKQKHDALAGNNDHTLTFLQRANFIQTGQMVALLH